MPGSFILLLEDTGLTSSVCFSPTWSPQLRRLSSFAPPRSRGGVRSSAALFFPPDSFSVLDI